MTDARPRAQTSEGLDDERKAVGQVVTRPAVELHPLAFFAGDHPEAVVLISCTHSSAQGGCGVHFCFRNSKLEDFHDRISDAEMKALMIDVVNHSLGNGRECRSACIPIC